ncbi:hypothetical protein MHU86_7321 [Fragilaria crotonensis]|nr:hypothetical protein MHU86_7321 [Fragilaria crotonensis]
MRLLAPPQHNMNNSIDIISCKQQAFQRQSWITPPPSAGSSTTQLLQTRFFHFESEFSNPVDPSRGPRPHRDALDANKKILALGRDRDWKEILRLPRYRHGYLPHLRPVVRTPNFTDPETDDMPFNNVSYATALTQLGRIQSFNKNDPMFLAFLTDLYDELQERGVAWMGPRQFSNIIHAIAKMELWNNQHASNILDMMDDEANAEWLMEYSNAHDVALLMWACAKLGFRSPNLFASMDRNAERLFESSNPQDIANCVWACGKLSMPSPNLFAVMDRSADRVIAEGTSQAVANCVWACAKLGVQSRNLFRLFDHEAERLFLVGSPQNLAMCVLSCAKVNVLPRNLVGLLEQNPGWLVTRCKSRDVAECAWALSQFGLPAPDFFAAIEENLDRFLSDTNSHYLIMLCRAMAVLDMMDGRHSPMFCKIWDRILMNNVDRSVDNNGYCMMHFILALAKAAGVDLVQPNKHLQTRLQRAAFPVESSSVADLVSNLLVDLGIAHTRNVSPFKSGLLPIDLACVDRMVAIECNGPKHYMQDLGDTVTRIENGPTKAKRRILQSLGWTVINLDCDDVVIAESEMNHDWLRDNLLKAGVDLRN